MNVKTNIVRLFLNYFKSIFHQPTLCTPYLIRIRWNLATVASLIWGLLHDRTKNIYLTLIILSAGVIVITEMNVLWKTNV